MAEREVRSPWSTRRSDSSGGHRAPHVGKGALSRRDGGAEPVQGGSGTAELERALDRGLARGDKRR